MDNDNDMNWHIAAREYLNRVCAAEYQQQRAAYKKKKGFQYFVSDYVKSLIECLNTNDEEKFKAIKMLEGYASAIGV